MTQLTQAEDIKKKKLNTMHFPNVVEPRTKIIIKAFQQNIVI